MSVDTQTEIRSKLQQIELRIAVACERSNRERDSVTLVAVTKTQPVSVIEAALAAGLRDLGESKVQELIEKRRELTVAGHDEIRWHMIGNLQSNKSKAVAPFIHLLHAVDTPSTVVELGKAARRAGRVLDLMIEVNISGEPQKYGIRPRQVESLCELVERESDALRLRGLMGVASNESDPERTRPQFKLLRELLNELKAGRTQPDAFDQLSMGMTNDFEIAIEEGSTHVRIGSALFGKREYRFPLRVQSSQPTNQD